MAHQWLVGEVYPGLTRNGLPIWTQPGGIGTAVLPAPQQFSPEQDMGYQQNIMSYPSLYAFNCGHFLNVPEIFEVYDPVNHVQVALVTCSQCGYIQEIISPYEVFDSYIETPLVIA